MYAARFFEFTPSVHPTSSLRRLPPICSFRGAQVHAPLRALAFGSGRLTSTSYTIYKKPYHF